MHSLEIMQSIRYQISPKVISERFASNKFQILRRLNKIQSQFLLTMHLMVNLKAMK